MGDQHSGYENTDVIGETINERYRIISHIGLGAMGDVYRASDLKLDRQVAVKILKGSLVDDRVFRARFEREARAAGKLSHHPNVITIFDVDETKGRPFIVMELVTGGTLSTRLKDGPLQIAEAISIAKQVLGALAFAHANGIIHRDIKPSNILMGPGGEVKVSDFGIASVFDRDGDNDLTLSSQLLGTPAYLSPERADGRRVTPSSDIFSVGVLLYEMVTGERPFKGDSPIAIVLAVRSGVFVPPETINPYLAAGLSKVIKRSLSLSPEARYSSAQHMAAALDFGAEPEDTAPLIGQAATQPIGIDVNSTIGLTSEGLPATQIGSSKASADPEAKSHASPFGNAGEILILWTAVAAFVRRSLNQLGERLANVWQKATKGQPHSAVLFVFVAMITFLVVALLFIHGGPSVPSHSHRSTTSTVVTTTTPSTTTSTAVTPTTILSPAPPAGPPPGHGKKGR